MKLWQKIYFFSLVLLIVTLNITGFSLVQNFHNKLLKREVDKCITQQEYLISDLQFCTSFVRKIQNDISTQPEYSIRVLMEDFSHNRDSNGYFQVLDENNKILYTDSDFPTPPLQEELNNLTDSTTHYVWRQVDNEYYLYVSSMDTINNTSLKFYSAKNISELYKERCDNYAFFIKLDIIICIVYAFFMFLISRLITAPIGTLIATTQKIASGCYSERVKLDSKDEFGILSGHFNLMAQTVEDKINELELTNVEKELFINSFTHELKTPLTCIIGYANIIRTAKYNEMLFSEASDYIYKEGKNLEQMAFKMMDFIYSHSENIELAPTSMKSILEEVRKSLFTKLEEKHIVLKMEISPTILMLDATLIKILLLNLLDNAIKVSPENTPIVITFVAEEVPTLTMTDYGTGIAKENLEKIWQPFYIVDKARTRKNNGVGLGLAICKKIATSHQATIHIKSQLGEGTTVILKFKGQKI